MLYDIDSPAYRARLREELERSAARRRANEEFVVYALVVVAVVWLIILAV